MCTKYLLNQDFLCISAKQGDSAVWRNITKCKELIRQGIAWTMGNGQDISFWRDNWIENRSLLDLLEVEDQETFNPNIKVSEFIEDK